MSTRPRVIKFILLGDSGVGKTSLLNRFCDGRFTAGSQCTIGVDFRWKDIVVPSPQPPAVSMSSNRSSEPANEFALPTDTAIRVHVWDTAGQEQYRVIATPYYRHAEGILLVYDVTSQASLAALDQVLEEAREMCPLGVVAVLVGNKSDVEPRLRCVSCEEGAQFAKRRGISLFFETSARNGDHVDDAFIVLAQHVIATQQSNMMLAPSRKCALCKRADAAAMCLVCSDAFCMDCQRVPHDARDTVPVVHREYSPMPPSREAPSPRGGKDAQQHASPSPSPQRVQRHTSSNLSRRTSNIGAAQRRTQQQKPSGCCGK